MKNALKSLAVLLSVCLLAGLLPAASLAEGDDLRTVYVDAQKALLVGIGTSTKEEDGVQLQSITVRGPHHNPDFDDATYLWVDYDAPGARDASQKIKRVSFVDRFAVPTMRYWFIALVSLQTIEGMENLDFSELKSTYAAFFGCAALEKADLRLLDTRNVTEMDYMFYNCAALQTPVLSSFRTENTESMSKMFAGCESLRHVDLSTFDTGKVTNMQGMFAGCTSLTSLDLSNFTVSEATHMGGMFDGCTALSRLTLGRDFRFTFSDPVPNDDYITSHLDQDILDLSTPGLPEPPDNAVCTGYWVLEGSDKYRLTSKQLMEQYDGETMAGTWVWEFKPQSISDAVVTAANQTYTGEALTPGLTVTLNGVPLNEGTEYSVVGYENNTEAGKATVTVAGAGDFTGSASGKFSILPADLVGANISVTPQPYTGKEVSPAVTVTLGGRTLQAGTDYTAFYKNNIEIGEAEVTVHGLGNYQGSASGTFSIVPIDLTKAKILIPAQTYTGEALTPPVIVTVNGGKLTEGTDYTVSYRHNKDAGEATVILTGIGRYQGTVPTSFVINAKSLADATITVPDAVFTGEPLTPKAKVTLNGETLTEGRDYTVSYKDNVNAGVATAVITGAGNYEGEIGTTFVIRGGGLSDARVIVSPQEYTGKVQRPAVTVTVNGVVLTEGKDYKVSYRDNKNAGEATAIVTGLGNYEGTATGTFVISARNISDATVTADDQAYTGKPLTPPVTVTLNGVTFVEGKDYTVEYKSNTDPGEAFAVVTGIGNCTGKAFGTFKIKGKKEDAPEDETKFLLGDVDGNGKVEAADARYALRAAVGLDDTKEGLDFSKKTNRCFLAADVTKDKNILAEDARLILRAAVGLETLS